MTGNREHEMIETLLELTRDGKLRWEGTIRGNVLQAALKDYVLRVKDLRRSEEAENMRLSDPGIYPPDYWIEVIDGAGERVDTIDGASLSKEWADGPERLAELYEIAKKDAEGTEERLYARVLKQLHEVAGK